MATTLAGDEVTWAYAADITKSEPTEDGHLMVHGKAANPTLDLDGQISDPEWLAQEMPDWFRWGNIRAQHGPVAAGVGKQLEADGADGWDLGALIVDSDSKEKVRTGVYKGFSIGIKGAKVIKDELAPNGRIVGGKIVEISLVDRPCNPDSKMTLVKSAGSVTAFEDPGDPESAVIETEILAPTAADGELIDPDDEQDAELTDLVKGFIEFLRGPKARKPARGGKGSDDRKRDKDGQFAAREARLKEREGRLRQRENAARGREADTRRAITENRLSSEALADAEHARTMGRTQEAGEHADAAASHAHDRRSRQQVAGSRLRIGKAAQPDVDSWDTASDEALEYVITKASTVLASRYLDGSVETDESEVADLIKGLMPDSMKRFFSAQERRKETDEGNAMPGGRFPIKTQDDLDNAVHLVGQADDQDAVRAHIRAMAKKHGLALPDSMTEKAARIDPEITKALQAQHKAHEGELAALRAELATVQEMLTKTAAPDVHAPVLVTQPALTKSANREADEIARVRRDAARATDPAVQRALLAHAETLEAGH